MEENKNININNISLNESNNFENKQINKNSGDKIFKKKYIILLFFSLIVFVSAIFIYLFVSGIDFNVITRLFSQQSNSKLLPLWLTILILSPFVNTICKSLALFIKIRKLNIKIHIWEWIELFFVQSAITIVTPFAVGGEPYGYYWLRRHKISHEKAITSIGANYLIYQICSTFFGTACLIYVLADYYPYFVSGVNGIDKTTGTISIWFSICGTLINVCTIIISFLSFRSIKLHVAFAKIWNWFLKKIGLNYKTTSQIIEYYQLNSRLKKAYLAELKKVKENVLIFIASIFSTLFSASLPYFSLNTLSYIDSHNNLFSFFDLIAFVSVSWTANSFIPIPGGEGTIQWVLTTFLTVQVNNVVIDGDLKNFINDGVFIWRFYTSYLIVVVGLIIFIGIVIRYKYVSNTLKKLKYKPLVSILIPCYNVEKYLPHIINNLLRQTYENYEILLCDDGSTDNTASICKQFTDNYSNIKLITNEKNIGVGQTRQKLIDMCKGDYFIFFDSDDYVDSSLLYSYVKKINKNYDIVTSKYRYCLTNPYYFFRFSINPPVTKWKKIRSQFDFVNNSVGFFWNVLINVEFYKSLNIFINERIFEDSWVLYMFIKARSFLFIKKYTYRYRVNRPNSISARESSVSKEMKKFNELLIAYENVFEKIINDSLYESNKNKINEILWFQSTLIIAKFMLMYQKNKKYNLLLNEFTKNKIVPFLKKYNYEFNKYPKNKLWYFWLKKHKLFKLIEKLMQSDYSTK